DGSGSRSGIARGRRERRPETGLLATLATAPGRSKDGASSVQGRLRRVGPRTALRRSKGGCAGSVQGRRCVGPREAAPGWSKDGASSVQGRLRRVGPRTDSVGAKTDSVGARTDSVGARTDQGPRTKRPRT